MTILVASIWGGRVTLFADRRVSRAYSGEIVQDEAAKILAVYCRDALFGITYTGVAIAEGKWMDQAIASCIAARSLEPALVQPGSFALRNPLYLVLKNLSFNLPIRLRTHPARFSEGLTIAIAGWHLKPKFRPFVCTLALTLQSTNVGGTMRLNWQKVGKHFRHYQSGLWMQSWGDEDDLFAQRLRMLGETIGYTHDDVERYIMSSIRDLSVRKSSVGTQCLALQIDPIRHGGQLQYTYYPDDGAVDPHSFLTGWTLSTTSINGPTRESTGGGAFSQCGRYVLGGHSDPKSGLHVNTRLPLESMVHGGPLQMSYSVEQRQQPPEK